MVPNTYRQLQQFIIERRRLQQRSDDGASSPCERLDTFEDIAAKLRVSASDAVAVKHLIAFALPRKKRASAVVITEPAKDNGADEQAHDQSRTMSAATEHDRKPTKELKQHDDGCQKENYDVALSEQTAKAMAKDFSSSLNKSISSNI